MPNDKKIPSPFQYILRLSARDRDLYLGATRYGPPASCSPLDVFARVMFLAGQTMPDARPCAIADFAVAAMSCVKTHNSKQAAIEAVRAEYERGGRYGPAWWDKDGEDKQAAIDRCWPQAEKFAEALWAMSRDGRL